MINLYEKPVFVTMNGRRFVRPESVRTRAFRMSGGASW